MHEDNIGGIDGNIGAGPNGDTDIGTNQCGRIIDAIADHGDHFALLLQRADDRFLLLRQHLRDDAGDADFLSNGFGRTAVIAGEQQNRKTHLPQGSNGGGAGFPGRIGHRDKAQGGGAGTEVQGRPAAGGQFFRLGGKGGNIAAHGAGQAGIAAPDGFVMEPGNQPLSFRGGKIGDRGKGNILFLTVGGDSGGQRVGTGGFQRVGHWQQTGIQLHDIGDGGLTGGNGTGFIQHDSGNTVGTLQCFGAFHQNAVFRAAAGAHHNSGGSGQTQGAGTADDQYGNVDGKGKGGCLADEQPNDHGQNSNADDDRDKNGSDFIGNALDGRFGGGGILHQMNDLGEGGFFPYMGGLHGEITAAAQGSAGDGIADGFIDRQAFAGDGGFIHSGLSFGDGAIHRDGFTRPNKEMIALLNFFQRDLHFLAIPQQVGGGGGQGHQLLQGIGGVAFAAGFPVFAHADKGENGAGGFKVKIHVVLGNQFHIPGGQPLGNADDGINAIQYGGGGADSHECIHGGGPAEQRGEAPAEVAELQHRNGQGKHQLHQTEPQGIVMAGKERGQRQAHHVAHRNIKENQQQPDADPQTAAFAAGLPRRGFRGGAASGARWAGAVAGRGHSPADFRLGKLMLIIFDQHTILHQIDGNRGNPCQRRDRPLHVGTAGGAAHAGDIKTLFQKLHLRGILYELII